MLGWIKAVAQWVLCHVNRALILLTQQHVIDRYLWIDGKLVSDIQRKDLQKMAKTLEAGIDNQPRTTFHQHHRWRNNSAPLSSIISTCGLPLRRCLSSWVWINSITGPPSPTRVGNSNDSPPTHNPPSFCTIRKHKYDVCFPQCVEKS